MGEDREKSLPGNATSYVERGEKDFSKIKMLLDATGGLSLAQVCAVTGVEGSTIQNWVKRGWVAHPLGKRYEEVHVARILIINALKECIKLQHIALLMDFVSGTGDDEGEGSIKESELYTFLNDALEQMGQSADHSRGGVEGVVETVIKGYRSPRPDSHIRIRKALTLMIFACVCTDVKRRTEAMMEQILDDLKNPDRIEAQAAQTADTAAVQEEPEPAADVAAQDGDVDTATVTHKTVSQALRQWDFSSVERVIIDADEDGSDQGGISQDGDKSSAKPWYVRRGTK